MARQNENEKKQIKILAEDFGLLSNHKSKDKAQQIINSVNEFGYDRSQTKLMDLYNKTYL